jgi:phosphatidylserine synthase
MLIYILVGMVIGCCFHVGANHYRPQGWDGLPSPAKALMLIMLVVLWPLIMIMAFFVKDEPQ